MLRTPALLAESQFDLLVVGGGAFGAAAAWDASLRGLKVALIERSDWGSGASSQCFKMVHGGIRYLQHADIRRLRSSCGERSAMLRIAPHLVHPLPIAIPTYGHGRKGKEFLGTGMRIYDLLSWDRNAGIRDRTRQIPGTRFLSRNDTVALFPDLEHKSLTGAAVFDDGQMYSPPRLVLAFVKSAAGQGAVVCNHVEATGFLRDGNRITGVHATDRLSGEQFDVRARLVLNAAGPGAEYLLGDPVFGRWQRGPFSRDACFVIRRRPQSPYAVAIQGQSRDRDALLAREGRHMFVVPWREYTLVGVWHKLFPDHPDTAHVTEDELATWIREIDAVYPTLGLTRDDVIYANCGLVPFGASATSEELSFGKESRYIDHRISHGLEGLVTLIGIRYTTCRGDAARALDMLLEQMPRAPGRSDTATTPLVGGNIPDFNAFARTAESQRPAEIASASFAALLRNHGTEYKSVIKSATATMDNSSRGFDSVPGTSALLAEVDHAVLREQAARLDDVILRRTNIGAAEHPGMPALQAVAGRMRSLLGWTPAKHDEELTRMEGLLARSLARPLPAA